MEVCQCGVIGGRAPSRVVQVSRLARGRVTVPARPVEVPRVQGS